MPHLPALTGKRGAVFLRGAKLFWHPFFDSGGGGKKIAPVDVDASKTPEKYCQRVDRRRWPIAPVFQQDFCSHQGKLIARIYC